MDLLAQKRSLIGKKAKNLTKQGFVLAELYGNNIENAHLIVTDKDLKKALKEFKGWILNLIIDGTDKRPVLIKEIQRDPITNEAYQIGFYQVRLDEGVKTKVVISLIGEAPAVKDKDGVLVKAMSDIEIEALPTNLPSNLEIDISLIKEIGQSVYVKDIKLPTGVKILVDPETVVATVIEKAAEEAPAPAASVSDVKVETEEKKQERLAKKQEETPPQEGQIG